MNDQYICPRESDERISAPNSGSQSEQNLLEVISEYLPILTRLEESGEWDRFAAGTGIATVNRLRTVMERAQKGQ